ncbi:unnamed protein product [Ixodes persulcatus]
MTSCGEVTAEKEHPFGLAIQEAHHSLDVGLVGLGLHVLYGSLELFWSLSVHDLKCEKGVKDIYSEGIAVERKRGNRYMETKDIMAGIVLGLDWHPFNLSGHGNSNAMRLANTVRLLVQVTTCIQFLGSNMTLARSQSKC